MVKMRRGFLALATVLAGCTFAEQGRFGISHGSDDAAVRMDRALFAYFRDFAEPWNETEYYTNFVCNAKAYEFMKDKIPLFECSDAAIERTYYFRWWTFRKHLKVSADGSRRAISEFMPYVGWCGELDTIACPMGHHLRDARWFDGGAWARDYLAFMLREGEVTGPRSYVNWPAVGAEDLAAVTGDPSFFDARLGEFTLHHAAWERGWPNAHWYNGRGTNELFRVVDGNEGMEGSACIYGERLIINCAFAANARAIAAMARRTGDAEVAADYAARAEALERLIRERLWNAKVGFFTSRLPGGTPVDDRDLTGYAPWYFGQNPEGCDAAWSQLFDTNGFSAPIGLTTLERRSKKFKILYEGHECMWNGPVWPYASSMTLVALANYLQTGGTALTANDYGRLLHQFAAAHVRVREDGRRVDWIDEDQDPFTGVWIARDILERKRAETEKRTGKRGRVERGKDYYHSSFVDLVISGLVGVRPSLARDVPDVRPLVPDDMAYFRLTNLRYHGKTFDIAYDRDGTRYGLGRGLTVRELKP